MLKIMVVEDVMKIGKDIVTIIEKNIYKIKVYRANSIDEAYGIAEKESIDVFFIHGKLGKNKDAIELGRKLRQLERYKRAIILYIGGDLDNELEAYRSTYCYRYVLEPYTTEYIDRLVKNICVSEAQRSFNKLQLDYGGISRFVKYADINYIELKNRKIYVMTNYGQIEYKRYAINKVLKQLSNNFIRVHQSYIVNKEYIEMIDWKRSIIKMNDVQEEISIGRTYRLKLERDIL